jgi:hypothetical protein
MIWCILFLMECTCPSQNLISDVLLCFLIPFSEIVSFVYVPFRTFHDNSQVKPPPPKNTFLNSSSKNSDLNQICLSLKLKRYLVKDPLLIQLTTGPVDWVQIWGCWVHWHIFNEYLKGKLKKNILGGCGLTWKLSWNFQIKLFSLKYIFLYMKIIPMK